MGFVDAIKKILNIFNSSEKIEDNKKINLSFLKNSKLIEVKTEITNNKQIYNINIDLSKSSEEQINSLSQVYPEIIEDKENGVLLIKKENFKTFEEYREESKDIPILKFFKGKLKEEDFEALRTSVFIKKKSDEGSNIEKLLTELRKRYGSRGGNICNLYCEGYFDSLIKQFYNILQSQQKEQNFLKEFDDFVTNLPISYFVNQHKPQELINEEIEQKISRAKKYGIEKINIHGIGKENKIKIDLFLECINKRKDISFNIIKEEDYRKSIQIIIKEI